MEQQIFSLFKQIIIGQGERTLNIETQEISYPSYNSAMMREFYIAHGYDVNTGNFDINALIAGVGLHENKKYPCAIMLPPTISCTQASTTATQEDKTMNITGNYWEEVAIKIAFVAQKQYGNDNNVTFPDSDTGTSLASEIDYRTWMATAAEDFYKVLKTILTDTEIVTTPTPNPDGLVQIQEILQTKPNDSPEYKIKPTTGGNDRLIGVIIEFKLLSFRTCEIFDYEEVPQVFTIKETPIQVLNT